MSIFLKPVHAMEFADLQELLAEQAVENVRLEFKSEIPSKDEALKKISSFANTFGGHLIIGAREGDNGRLVGLPGVEQIPGLRQKLVSWCYEGAWPPIEVAVSDPIPTSGNDSSPACFVVAVPESELAPHFLNRRRGVYIRTDEFSQRFEPQLATLEEITNLMNRKAVIQDRRERLISRAARRFVNYKPSVELEPTFLLTLCPTYPVHPLVDHDALLNLLQRIRVARGVEGFPRVHKAPISQYESAVILEPFEAPSFLEATVWGSLAYGWMMEREMRTDEGTREESTVRGIHLNAFVGNLLVFMWHAKDVYNGLGYTGQIVARVTLRRVLKKPFLFFPRQRTEVGPASLVDDDITLEVVLPATTLTGEPEIAAGSILRPIFYAMNWPGLVTNPAAIRKLIDSGAAFNHWQH